MRPIVAVSILDRAAGSFGDALPGVLAGVLVLIVGLVVASVTGRVTRRTLAALGADSLGERFGIHDAIASIGLERSLSDLVGRAVRLIFVVVVVIAAASLLGLGALNEALNAAVLFVPKLLLALAIVLAGFVAGEFARRHVDALADQMDVGLPVGQAAQVAVVSLFTLTALALIGIPTGVLTGLVALLVLAAAFTVALAFGLGGRDVARQVSAGRYVGGAFELGQTVTVGGVRGQIVAIESAATVLRDDEGQTLRIPNQLLLESIVTVEPVARSGSP